MSEKATFTSFSESFHVHLNETYANAETILKTFSNGDMSFLPPVSVASRISRKRWRDCLQELEKKYEVPTYLNSSLKLLKCLISDAARNGTQYIVIAPDTSGSINVFYDDTHSAIRLDNAWLDATTRWPPAEKSLQFDYLNRIKSIGIEAADVIAFKRMYMHSCDIGNLKIEQALVQSGYQVGYTTIHMQSKLIDSSFRTAIGSDAISAEKLGGPVIGRLNHIHTYNYNFDLWNRFTNANPSFNKSALVINLWSHNGKPLEPAADIHFRNRLCPFKTGETPKKIELPYFYIKPNLSNLQLASDGSWTENAVKVFDKDTFSYPHFRSLIANKKYDHIELVTVFKSDMSYKIDKISWVSPEAIGVTYKSNEGSNQTE